MDSFKEEKQYVIVEEGKELFEMSLQSCSEFVTKAETFKEWVVIAPSRGAGNIVVKVLEAYIRVAMVDKKAFVKVGIEAFVVATSKQPIEVMVDTEVLGIKELEVCKLIVVFVIRSLVERKEAIPSKEVIKFHESTVFLFLELGLIHKDCIMDLEECQYFFSLVLSKHCTHS